MDEQTLTNGQVSLIRTLWELAQGRIDAIYSPQGAEKEKVAVEEWMRRVFPTDCDEWIRAIQPTERG